MKPCERSDETLNAFVDGELDAEDAERVRAHLDGCEACREKAEVLGGVRDLAQATAPTQPSSDEWDAAWGRVKGALPATPLYGRIWPALAGAGVVAAAAAFVFALGILWTDPPTDPGPGPYVAVEMTVEMTVEISEEDSDGSAMVIVDESGPVVILVMNDEDEDAPENGST